MITAGELAADLGLPAPTTEQAAVIEAPLEPGLVVAGAGSGKTETMAARVVYLVATGQVQPEQVLGLTFTRKAAAALSQRVRRRLRMLGGSDLVRRSSVDGRSGDGLSGDGLSGDGLSGDGLSGDGLSGVGLSGDGLSGVGPSSDGLSGVGLSGVGLSGVGLSGVGLSGVGLSGVGLSGVGLSGDPEVVTYHSFGGRLIADFGPLAGVEPASRVLTPTGAWQLARRVVGRWDGDLDTDLGPDQVTERLLAISGALADHLTGADALAAVLDDLLVTMRSAPAGPRQRSALHSGLVDHVKRLQDRQWILPLVQAFADAKRDRGVIDFADQMQIAATLVGGHPRIGVALREKFRVVLLDEYQDTGHAQRVILRTLFGAGESGVGVGHPVTAVGDPVQSIYSWRGASASNLPRFVTDFPRASKAPAATRSLLTSFRNPPSVLRLANELSASIRSGPDAPVEVGELRPMDGAPPGEIRYGLFPTVVDEDAWLARSIADRWSAAKDRADSAPPTTAVLLRRRSDMPATAEALRAAGLPVEVVGLGGLLDEPEIADLVATLRILVDPTAGAAAIRLLTGARWQLGAADLETLAQRSRALVRMGAAGTAAPQGGRDAVRAAVAQALSGEDIDAWCLVDAISDPGPPGDYSPEGHRRLARYGAHLRRLRGRLGQPLPDLMADLERATGLDIEVQLGSPAGRAHLDAFADVVADVAATGAGPSELLGYLDAAAEREDGLTPGEVPESSGRVQVLTVHAAKGLEWQIVAVPHLTAGVFPITRGSTWLGDAAQLPPDIRGDRDELPQLKIPANGNQKDIVDALAAHAADFGRLRLTEERRLLYVALTRSEQVLLLSGHHWGASTAKPAGPSEFLIDCAALAKQWVEPDEWAAAPDATEDNPLTAVPRTASWPVDPLGTRRQGVQSGADRVLAAVARMAAGNGAAHGDGDSGRHGATGQHDDSVEPEDSGAQRDASGCSDNGAQGDSGGHGGSGGDGDASGHGDSGTKGDASGHGDSGAYGSSGGNGAAGGVDDPFGWAADVTTLLAERAVAHQSSVEVALPGTMSVSALVELADDPQRLARRLRRPVPLEPAPQLRRGTAFHQWLERFFRGEALLDVRDLPGAGDGWAGDDEEFEQLRRQFLSSPWANRVPVEIEVPFTTRIADVGVRGRIDAVFADTDGGLTVVDWKTGHPPPPARRAALNVQLACYRLAMAELSRVPLARVRAAYHYVPTGTTIAPVDLLDATGIGQLIATATGADAAGTGEDGG